MDGNDNVIEKDFASAFDHERRGGFWGISPGKKRELQWGKRPQPSKRKDPENLVKQRNEWHTDNANCHRDINFLLFFGRFSLFLNGYEADSQLINLRHLAARGR